MVWTRETGIFEVAVEDKRWPPIWKAAKGRVVFMTSRVGYRMPCRRAGILFLRLGKTVESQLKRRQKKATKANCIMVRVAGLGKALRMDLEDVFVRALDKYHMIHNVYKKGTGTISMGNWNGVYLALG